MLTLAQKKSSNMQNHTGWVGLENTDYVWTCPVFKTAGLLLPAR